MLTYDAIIPPDGWRAALSRVRTATWVRPLAAFVAPLFLYLSSLAPTIYNLDSAELTTAAATGGIVRATGYPLYLALGHAWALLPIGDVGFRMNLFSAVAGAGTLWLLERLLTRLGVGGWAILGALGLLMTAPYFWALSVIAEVYTLHTLLLATLLLLLLRWHAAPSAGRLAAVGLAVGLGGSHHVAMVLAVPGIALFVLSDRRPGAVTVGSLAAALLAALAGLSLYLTLPLRLVAGPAFNYAGTFDALGRFEPVDLWSVGGLWWLASGRAFAGQMLAYTPVEFLHELRHFGGQLAQSFFLIGLGPGLVGIWRLWRRRRRVAATLLLIFAANVLFYAGYRVIDKDTMFLPAYLIWTLFVGVGLDALLAWVRVPEDVKGRLPTLMHGLIAAAILAAALWNWPLVSRAGDHSARMRGEEMLAEVGPDALILGWWETVPVIEYLQQVEGRRPDVTAINRFLLQGGALGPMLLREVPHRPVYMDSVPALPPRLMARAKGELFLVTERPVGSQHLGPVRYK